MTSQLLQNKSCNSSLKDSQKFFETTVNSLSSLNNSFSAYNLRQNDNSGPTKVNKQ